jgi:Circularly permutated YpsA SLOG family
VRDITILSGGQTGADRAALDFALELGLAHGGWCPRGRRAEDGPIDEHYELIETPSHRYTQRTHWNVRDSDATVVFTIAREVTGGTKLTIALAERLRKPCLHLSRESASGETTSNFGEPGRVAVGGVAERLLTFLFEHHVQRLNVAGPRASQEPGAATFVRSVLIAALDLSERTE